MKDYYKILGVEKSASKDEIKKAFRKLAHEHHPDKQGGSDAKFKEASEAYSVLSDDSKRKQYDTFGSAGPSMGGGGYGGGAGGFEGFDFSQFTGGNGQGFEFDLGDLFGDLFGGGGRGRQKKGSDIYVDIQVSFKDSVFGVEKNIVLSKKSTCATCSGTGGKPGTGTKTCDTCHGKGKVNETRRSFMGNFTTTQVCPTCKGAGQIPKEKCTTCRGEGITESKQEIGVRIPPGINDGEMVRLTGMGEAIQGGKPGDLYVRIHVEKHSIFKKEKDSLFMNLEIKLSQALLGAEIPVQTLDGELIMTIPEGTNNGEILRVKGKGVVHDRTTKRGDLFITISVLMPKRLSRSAKKAIEDLQKEGL